MAKVSNQFRSKTHGFGKAKKRWVCSGCLMMHETKVTKCHGGGGCTDSEIVYCDSEKEAKRYQVLRRREEQRRIFGLEAHPVYKFPMINDLGETVYPLKYVADFSYYTNEARFVNREAIGAEPDRIEDVKPKSPLAWTDSFKIKKRLMKELFNIEISIVTKEDQ